MESAWWGLPGPRRYIELVEEHLREGRSVLLRHPENFPASLKDAIARRVTASDLWMWRSLELDGDDASEDPVVLLTQRFAIDADRQPSTRQLMESESCRGLVVWIDGIDRKRWKEWTEFLVDYDRHARNAAGDHLLLCIHLEGEFAAEAFPGLAAVATCSWKRVVERHDMLLFVAELVRGHPDSGLLRDVRLAVCTELSGTDGELAIQLARTDLDTLIRPLTVLQGIARARNLKECQVDAASWQAGMSEYWGDRWRLNSCVAAVLGQGREIKRRVWKAEIGVVFPFIEEQRVEIVELIRPMLKLPIQTEFGVIEEASDLEIGQLLHCARVSGMRGPVRRSLEHLTGMRHALAHLEPVDSDQLRGALRFGANR